MLVPAVAMAGGAARSEWRGTAIRHSRKRVCARVDDDATSRDGSYVSTTSSSAAVVPVLIVGRSVRCRSLAYYFPRSCEAECILSQLYGNSSHLYWKWPVVGVWALDEAPLGGGSAALDWDGD